MCDSPRHEQGFAVKTKSKQNDTGVPLTSIGDRAADSSTLPRSPGGRQRIRLIRMVPTIDTVSMTFHGKITRVAVWVRSPGHDIDNPRPGSFRLDVGRRDRRPTTRKAMLAAIVSAIDATAEMRRNDIMWHPN